MDVELGGPAAKYVCWDFDGTLAYRSGMWSGCLREILLRKYPECGITREEIRPHVSFGFPWHEPETAHTEIADADGWWSRLTPLFVNAFRAVLRCEEDEALALAAGVRPAYLDIRGWSVFDDTFECLEELRSEGWRHVILSNHVPELPLIVAGLRLSPYVERIFNSAESGYEKPHPRAFQQVIEYCGAGWMVGDNPVADVAGARAVGMNALLVRSAGEGLAAVPNALRISRLAEARRPSRSSAPRND